MKKIRSAVVAMMVVGSVGWAEDEDSDTVVKSGERFYGTRAAWKNGSSYTDEEGESVWVTTSGAKVEDEE